MSFFKKINKENPAVSNALIVLCITLLGVFLRLQYLQKTDFAINDGGMFFTMIQDLQNNNYILPHFTSYNLSHIPYAYPPLSFYEGAILNQILHIDLITILRFYPIFFNILSIPAFYFLAREITHIDRQALIATAFYVILLPSFEWLISGGGLTRSPAHSLFIAALYLFLVFLRTRKTRILIFSIITAACMTLHHIEYCWVLAFSIVVFSVFQLKFKEFIQYGLIYGFGIALLTSPYWITVISYHGLAPFISAFSTGDFDIATSFWRLILLILTRESLVTYINVLAILGIWFSLFSRKYRVIIWFLLITFFDPRSAERLLIFPVTILASYTIEHILSLMTAPSTSVVGPAIESTKNTSLRHSFIGKNFTVFFVGFSILYPFLLGFLHTFEGDPSLTGLPVSQREAMNWIKNNTPEDSNFVVLNTNKTWSTDSTSEWFPAISERRNIITVQGTEWLPASTYLDIKRWSSEVKDCFSIGESCLSTWGTTNRIGFDYLFISKLDTSKTCEKCDVLFTNSIQSSQKYLPVFENEGAAIFKKKK
jgi:hypothetical protein